MSPARILLLALFLLGYSTFPPLSVAEDRKTVTSQIHYEPRPGHLLPLNKQPAPLKLQTTNRGGFPAWSADGKPLIFMSYNVLSLQTFVGKWTPDPDTGIRNAIVGPGKKPEKETKGIADVIKSVNPDLVCLQEVEGPQSLVDFNEQYLDSAYFPLLVQGNDGRGIQIGFLVKKALPLDFELQSFRREPANDPLYPNVERVFSRDLPALTLYAPGSDVPLLTVLGTHYKSKRTDIRTDVESHERRQSQVERTTDIIAFYQGKHPKLPILLSGDFNGTLHEEPEYVSLFAVGMKDTMELGSKAILNIHDPRRITHTYHPRDNAPTEAHQIDAILANTEAAGAVLSGEVIPYVDENGLEMAVAKTFNDRKKQPSDHRAVKSTFDKKKLFRVSIGN